MVLTLSSSNPLPSKYIFYFVKKIHSHLFVYIRNTLLEGVDEEWFSGRMQSLPGQSFSPAILFTSPAPILGSSRHLR